MVDVNGFLYNEEPSHIKIIGIVPNKEGKL